MTQRENFCPTVKRISCWDWNQGEWGKKKLASALWISDRFDYLHFFYFPFWKIRNLNLIHCKKRLEPDHVIALEPRSKLCSRHRDLFPILLSELIVICSKQVWSECHIINYFYIHESYWGILAHGRFCAGLLCFVRVVMTSGFAVVLFCWFCYSIIWLQTELGSNQSYYHWIPLLN